MLLEVTRATTSVFLLSTSIVSHLLHLCTCCIKLQGRTDLDVRNSKSDEPLAILTGKIGCSEECSEEPLGVSDFIPTIRRGSQAEELQ